MMSLSYGDGPMALSGASYELSNSYVAIHWHAAMPPEYYWLSTKHMLEQKL